ncbi:TetR/AcrR family transcriptional regulator [Nocardia sp. NPDC051911]|uniref:TetR/AcrR family transcriptional regulator n=1 Tax=unclassified Nocardia TaxID=2637762 RepID=UPI003416EBE8
MPSVQQNEYKIRRRYERAPRRGEERRTALLKALEQLLEKEALAQIGIADIAKAAGVTRSAFYFYFPTKAAAVAALLEGIYEELLEGSGTWHMVDGSARHALRAGFEAVISYCEQNINLMAATWDAVGSDREVRELWEGWMEELVKRVGAKISDERTAGRAPAGTDANVIAEALVFMNERILEREVRARAGGGEPTPGLSDAIFEIWDRTIYGIE